MRGVLVMSFRFTVSLGLSLIAASCASAPVGALGAATVSRAPYVQMATPDSAVVVWRTASDSKPAVRYGKSPESLDEKVEAGESITVRVPGPSDEPATLPRLTGAREGTRQYEARITGLEPNTTYFYAVYDGDTLIAGGDADHNFRTHPPAGKAAPMRFWVVGDSGTSGKDQRAVHDAMRAWTKEQNRPLDFYLHVGDMAYHDGTDAQFQDTFFRIYEVTLRNTVCWPTMGNHEGHTSNGAAGVGPYYDAYVVPTRAEAGGVASGMEAYYSFEYANAHFICLDSHDLDRKPEGAMARWLKEDLEKAKSDWLIAFWHHPPYTKGSHDSDREDQLVEMRTHIMPILESAGVDLVLTGHSHIYERSMLMDGAYETPTVAEGHILDDGDGDPDGDGAYRKSAGLNPHEGTVQVVAGHGGAPLGRRGSMPVMRSIVLEHGSVIVDIDGDTLKATMLNRDGRTRDLFGIVKRGKVTPTRVSKPWRPAPFPRTQPQVVKSVPLPANYEPLIEPNAEWRYLAGGKHPEPGWTRPEFEADAADGWKTGAAGFGYGDGDDRTVLADMANQYTTVYMRREFDVDDPAAVAALGLAVNYDDGFIAYLNGREVLRENVSEGRGPDAQGIEGHEAVGHVYFPLNDYLRLLRKGKNVLAVEGHNLRRESTDMTIHPYLLKKKQE
jgi:hypothetical protein